MGVVSFVEGTQTSPARAQSIDMPIVRAGARPIPNKKSKGHGQAQARWLKLFCEHLEEEQCGLGSSPSKQERIDRLRYFRKLRILLGNASPQASSLQAMERLA